VDPMAERVARNDAAFREANEEIGDRAAPADVELVPFICECADPRCTEIVRLSLDDYERIRADSRHFLNLPGHERSAAGFAQVIGRGDGYVVIEKQGEAGEIVEELDARGTLKK
jgi:hypothetical protein